MQNVKAKRPNGITIIAILWFFSGLANVYFGFQVISQDVEFLPYLSDSTLHSWFNFGVPAEILLSIANVFLGFLQVITVFGLWTGKSYSYKLALSVPILLVIGNISSVGVYATAPTEIDLGSALSTSIGILIWSIIFAAVYWSYLGKPHVKVFLGVESAKPVFQGRLTTPINQEKLVLSKKEIPVATSPKFYCRYCGSKNNGDAIYCERCGKNLSKRNSSM